MAGPFWALQFAALLRALSPWQGCRSNALHCCVLFAHLGPSERGTPSGQSEAYAARSRSIGFGLAFGLPNFIAKWKHRATQGAVVRRGTTNEVERAAPGAAEAQTRTFFP